MILSVVGFPECESGMFCVDMLFGGGGVGWVGGWVIGYAGPTEQVNDV